MCLGVSFHWRVRLVYVGLVLLPYPQTPTPVVCGFLQFKGRWGASPTRSTLTESRPTCSPVAQLLWTWCIYLLALRFYRQKVPGTEYYRRPAARTVPKKTAGGTSNKGKKLRHSTPYAYRLASVFKSEHVLHTR